MTQQSIALFFLGTLAAGGVAWVFLYPLLSGEAQAERRRESVAGAEPVVRKSAARGQKTRREQVEESLKELDVRKSKTKRVPLSMRIEQAGLGFSKRQFLIGCAILGVLVFSATLATWRPAWCARFWICIRIWATGVGVVFSQKTARGQVS